MSIGPCSYVHLYTPIPVHLLKPILVLMTQLQLSFNEITPEDNMGLSVSDFTSSKSECLVKCPHLSTTRHINYTMHVDLPNTLDA